MIITALKQQQKNPHRVSVFVDGKYSFSLSLDELVTHKLKKDDVLGESDIKKLKKVSADGKLRARTLEWLINRPHSERELRDYLYRKKTEPALIDNFINEFTQKGYLNNTKFAAWFTELQARRGKSNRVIRSELYKKGVGREVINEVLTDSSDESDRLKVLIIKKQKLTRYKTDKSKLAKYLISQGFSYSSVKEALNLNDTLR